MKSCWSFLGSLLFSVICFVLPDHAVAARHALVIGNDNYKHLSELKKARADANSIERVLKANGYSVTKKLDLTDAQMRKQVREFLRTLNNDDEVIFFYAGHGVQINNSNFLLGTDIQGADEKEIQDEALPLQQILKDFSTKQLKFTLAIIDACRDNPFQALGRNIGSRGLAPTNPVTGQMIIYSAGADQQALDRLSESDLNPNSVFTRAMLQEFDKGRRSVREILLDVRRTVVAQAKVSYHHGLG